MDRFDERKEMQDDDEVGGRTGDVLGLGGSAVPKASGEPEASDDPEAARRPRSRAMSADDDPTDEKARR
jgi:hypothetical protein